MNKLWYKMREYYHIALYKAPHNELWLVSFYYFVVFMSFFKELCEQGNQGFKMYFRGWLKGEGMNKLPDMDEGPPESIDDKTGLPGPGHCIKIVFLT